jgi:hypothetical protein
LPVVARKKGLDGYYEKTDGNAQPKKVPKAVAPVRILLSIMAMLYNRHSVGTRYIWL